MLNSVGNVLMNKEQLQNRPMKGFIQIFQVIFSCVAIIVIISILINKFASQPDYRTGCFCCRTDVDFQRYHPWLCGGGTALQRMISCISAIGLRCRRINVNGVVMDITLNIVKVQNFDNTIVTIPPYSLVLRFIYQLAWND